LGLFILSQKWQNFESEIHQNASAARALPLTLLGNLQSLPDSFSSQIKKKFNTFTGVWLRVWCDAVMILTSFRLFIMMHRSQQHLRLTLVTDSEDKLIKSVPEIARKWIWFIVENCLWSWFIFAACSKRDWFHRRLTCPRCHIGSTQVIVFVATLIGRIMGIARPSVSAWLEIKKVWKSQNWCKHFPALAGRGE